MQPGSNTGSAPEATRHISRCRHGMSLRDVREAAFRAIMHHNNDHDLRMQHTYQFYAKQEHYVASAYPKNEVLAVADHQKVALTARTLPMMKNLPRSTIWESFEAVFSPASLVR